MADKILQYMNWPQQDAEYALLLNNLGITSNLEMGVLLRSAIHYLTAQHVRITRVFSGAFMTATDMSGFSISLLKLDNERKKYIDAEVQVCASLWLCLGRPRHHSVKRGLWMWLANLTMDVCYLTASHQFYRP